MIGDVSCQSKCWKLFVMITISCQCSQVNSEMLQFHSNPKRPELQILKNYELEVMEGLNLSWTCSWTPVCKPLLNIDSDMGSSDSKYWMQVWAAVIQNVESKYWIKILNTGMGSSYSKCWINILNTGMGSSDSKCWIKMLNQNIECRYAAVIQNIDYRSQNVESIYWMQVTHTQQRLRILNQNVESKYWMQVLAAMIQINTSV
jgi:hypothetical protein